MNHKYAALFVSLANMCRSPMAEGVFKNILRRKGVLDQWKVDSCGLEIWHKGQSPDPCTRRILDKFTVGFTRTPRKITIEDFHNFDYIFGMDEDCFKKLYFYKPEKSKAQVLYLGDFDEECPHCMLLNPFGDPNQLQYEKLYKQCRRCCEGFMKHFEKIHKKDSTDDSHETIKKVTDNLDNL